MQKDNFPYLKVHDNIFIKVIPLLVITAESSLLEQCCSKDNMMRDNVKKINFMTHLIKVYLRGYGVGRCFLVQSIYSLLY